MRESARIELSDRTAGWVLAGVVVVYLGIGSLFAADTPPWQVPDEPAHYNYVRFVAEKGRLPELRLGDYPQDYLEQLKAARFPPALSIDPIRYESHQPPLYYAMAAGVYRVASQLGLSTLLALRLFSLALGAASLYIGFRAVRALLPGEPLLALGTVAFAATLPMHLAMTAAVNNDVLAEVLLGLVVWRLGRAVAERWCVRGEPTRV